VCVVVSFLESCCSVLVCRGVLDCVDLCWFTLDSVLLWWMALACVIYSVVVDLSWFMLACVDARWFEVVGVGVSRKCVDVC